MTRVEATAGGATVPFAPFAGLLPATAGSDPLDRVRAIVAAVDGHGDRAVLVVDEAHALDELSVVVLRNIASTTEVRILLGIRTAPSSGWTRRSWSTQTVRSTGRRDERDVDVRRELSAMATGFLLQDPGLPPGKYFSVERPTLVTDVDRELDDALSTLWLVRGNSQLSERLFEQVVDLLLERILLDLRTELVAGTMTANGFAAELAKLADQCRAVGLLSPDQ